MRSKEKNCREETWKAKAIQKIHKHNEQSEEKECKFN